VTLPYPYGQYLATSPLEMINATCNSGVHTLVILDLDPTGMGLDLPTPMKPEQAVSVLERMSKRTRESEAREGIDADVREWEGILWSDIGTHSQRVSSGSLHELSLILGGYVHPFVIP
jgi:Diphthamide biosynthesis methyltransferase